jgi:beta-lactamase regulating signal transducer with metallopeptidase domain
MTMLLAVKATLAMLIALGAAALLRRARASLRHAVFAALFAFLLLLPFSPLLVPAMNVTVPARAAAAATQTIAPAPVLTTPTSVQPAAPRVVPTHWLRDLYLAGVALMLASLAAGVVRLRRWTAAGEVWLDGTRLATEVACANGIRRAVLVVLSDDTDVPMTYGFRRQTIVVPADAREWDDDSLRRALRHELEHVRRDDWMLQVLGRIACAFYWPHPLVWVAWRRFCLEAERACDDAVVRAFEPTTYAQQLVTLARTLTRRMRRPRVPALAMASPTRLAERVHAILDPAQRRGPHGRAASVVTVMVMATALGLFGSVRLVAAVIDDPPRGTDEQDVDIDNDAGAASLTAALHGDRVIKAAERGDVGAIEELLAGGFDVNTNFDGDGTMLLIAARAGHLDAVRFLLDRGADPNVPSPGDGNPLIAAAGYGRGDVVKLLLARGARIDEVVPGDENALITASAAGYAGVVQFLIERGADVNLGVQADTGDGPRWRTPLIMARRHGHDDIVQLLLAAGARD